jgi:hypothetical protein
MEGCIKIRDALSKSLNYCHGEKWMVWGNILKVELRSLIVYRE